MVGRLKQKPYTVDRRENVETEADVIAERNQYCLDLSMCVLANFDGLITYVTQKPWGHASQTDVPRDDSV